MWINFIFFITKVLQRFVVTVHETIESKTFKIYFLNIKSFFMYLNILDILYYFSLLVNDFLKLKPFYLSILLLFC